MRLNRFVGILIGLFFLSGLPAFEFTKDAVRCVQNQLNEAGFDAGVVDGSVGPKSRRALAAYEKEHGTVSKRGLSRGTALVYCRLIGLQKFELQKHWLNPSTKREIIFGSAFTFPNVNPGSPIHRLRSEIAVIDAILRSRLNLKLAAPIKIVVANSINEAITMQKKHSKLVPVSSKNFIRKQCGTNLISGYAMADLIVLCRNGTTLPENKNLLQHLHSAISHELFHAYQYQLIGKTWVKSQSSYTRLNSPLWMIEGTANFVGVVMGYKPSLEIIESFSIEGVFKKRKTMVGLDKLKTSKSRAKYEDTLYHVGTLAVAEMLGSDNLVKLIEFYDHLGQTTNWTDAFELTFDEPFKTFEARFNERFMKMTRENPIPEKPAQVFLKYPTVQN